MGNDTSTTFVDQHRYPSGNVYSGQMRGKKRHGKGTLTWPDGARYEGSFADDFLWGYGKLTFPNGSIFEGTFVRNNPHGAGRLTTRNAEVLDGTWEFHGRSDQTNVAVGKYQFSGALVDLKTNFRQQLFTPLALYLTTGLVSLPNMADPMEAMLPYAVATGGGEKGETLGGVAPVASVVQSVTSSSDGIKFGGHEPALRARDPNDHAAADVMDPRLWLGSLGLPVQPKNTNLKKQIEIRTQQAMEDAAATGTVPVAVAVPQSGNQPRVVFQ